jgi:hypothetical protein
MLMPAFQNQSAKLKRGLGLLLLVFIFYGTTVEAAHRHGRVVPRSNPAAASFDKTAHQHNRQLSRLQRLSDLSTASELLGHADIGQAVAEAVSSSTTHRN